jgi:hypothetical protein
VELSAERDAELQTAAEFDRRAARAVATAASRGEAQESPVLFPARASGADEVLPVTEDEHSVSKARELLYGPLAPSKQFGDMSVADSDGSWRWNLVSFVVGGLLVGVWGWKMGYSSGREDEKNALRIKLERYRKAVSVARRGEWIDWFDWVARSSEVPRRRLITSVALKISDRRRRKPRCSALPKEFGIWGPNLPNDSG